MKSITYLLIVISTFLLAWFIPWAADLAKSNKVTYPFPYYSCINNEFCYTVNIGGGMLRTDASGRKYTEAEYDSILPFFYFRQLLKDDRLPDSILGVEVTPRIINNTNFFFKYSPKDKNTPTIKLFPLFESMSKKVDLALPGDVFRFKDKIEFVDPVTNTVKLEKSKLFGDQFEKKGFKGSAKLVAGTPTIKKSYDEGYFIVDDHNQVFHLKMVNGKPFVKNTGVDTSLRVKFIVTTEYPSKAFYGFLFDCKNQLYVISTEGYKLIRIPTPDFSLDNDDLLILGNMFHWTVKVTSDKGVKAYAVDANTFARVDTVFFAAPPVRKSFLEKWGYPFSLSFTSANEEYVRPRIEFTGWYFIIVGVLLASVFQISVRKKVKYGKSIPISLWIIVTGIFGFISTILFTSLKFKS